MVKHMWVCLLIGWFGAGLAGCVENHTTVILNPDGSCNVSTNIVIPREQVQQIVDMRNMFAGAAETEAAEDAPEASEDERLARQVRELLEEDLSDRSDDTEAEIGPIEVDAEHVRIQMTVRYASAGDFAGETDVFGRWGYPNIEMHETAEGNLALKLSRSPDGKGNMQRSMQYLTSSGFKGGFRLVMPGKIVSSPLPGIDGKATWIDVDAGKKEDLETLAAVGESDVLSVVSEMGAFAAELPLDSRKLRMALEAEKSPFAGLPLQPAEEGFFAEALSVTTTRVIEFPEGKAFSGQIDRATFEKNREGATVRARMYTPPGRFFYAVQKVSDISAVDSKGRDIAAVETPDSPAAHRFVRGEEPKAHTDFEISLALPEKNAEAIDLLEGAAEVVTFGGWAELKTGKPAAGKTHDLSSLIDGAFLEIKKVDASAEDGGGRLVLRLQGPEDIRMLEMAFAKGNVSYHNMSSSFKKNGKDSVRDIELQYYQRPVFSDGARQAATPAEMTLMVRKPDRMKRELVEFALEMIDLY